MVAVEAEAVAASEAEEDGGAADTVVVINRLEPTQVLWVAHAGEQQGVVQCEDRGITGKEYQSMIFALYTA